MLVEWDESQFSSSPQIPRALEGVTVDSHQFSNGLTSPGQYDSYGRLLRPVESVAPTGAVKLHRWKSLADIVGCPFEDNARLDDILGSRGGPSFLHSAEAYGAAGSATAWVTQLQTLGSMLRDFTNTPEECVFAFNRDNTVFDCLENRVRTVRIHGKEYVQCEGPVENITASYGGLEWSLLWPRDERWFAASEPASSSLVVGGDASLIEQVIRHHIFEARRYSVDHPQ